jgi:hypothetical protein
MERVRTKKSKEKSKFHITFSVAITQSSFLYLAAVVPDEVALSIRSTVAPLSVTAV